MELLNFKVYDISDNYDMLRVCVYLNVMMCDYIIDTKNNKLVNGSIDDKREFEYELIFIKNHDDTDYVMSMKKCINQMSITKNENKDIDYLNQIKKKLLQAEKEGKFTTEEGRTLLKTFKTKVEGRTK